MSNYLPDITPISISRERYRKLLEAEEQRDALRNLLTPHFQEEPGVMQEIDGRKHFAIPLPQYRAIQNALAEPEADE